MNERLPAAKARGQQADNERTLALALEIPRVHEADFAALFSIHFQAIRDAHAAVTHPGVLGLAFDLGSSQLVGRRAVKARSGAIDAITIGRHERCELPLPRDRSVSLRHLCLIVHPRQSDPARIRFRLVDLRTQLAFQDCFGQRMQAVEADGPAMIGLGRYALLLLPTGGFELPPDAARAWALVADPLYLEYRTEYLLQALDEAASDADLPPALALSPAAPAARSPARTAGGTRTSLTLLDGPQRPALAARAAGEPMLGVLEVEAGGEIQRLPIDRASAQRGLLIGSYDRCDDPYLTHLTHAAISRVHLLIIASGGELFAVDTASSNGTFVQLRAGRRVRARVIKLEPGIELTLADARARLRLRPADR